MRGRASYRAHLKFTGEKFMLRLLKSITLVLGLTGFAIFATNCGTDHAQMRLVHAIPDAGNQDAVLDGKTVATNVAFDSVSPASGYVTVNAGNPKLEVRNTGTGTDLINSNVNFSSKAQYTVVATGCENPANCNQTGTNSTVAPVVLTDNNSAPTSGNVNLRVVHASPSAGTSFDIYIVPAGTNISG